MSLESLEIRAALKPVQAELDRQKEKCAAMKKERDSLRAENAQFREVMGGLDGVQQAATMARLQAELAAQESLSAATLEQLARVTEQAHALTKRADELEGMKGRQGWAVERWEAKLADLRTQRDALHARAQAAELRVAELERQAATTAEREAEHDLAQALGYAEKLRDALVLAREHLLLKVDVVVSDSLIAVHVDPALKAFRDFVTSEPTPAKGEEPKHEEGCWHTPGECPTPPNISVGEELDLVCLACGGVAQSNWDVIEGDRHLGCDGRWSAHR